MWRDILQHDPRGSLSLNVHYQAARFPVADLYLTQFYHSRSQVMDAAR
jgi:hypothetical protein